VNETLPFNVQSEVQEKKWGYFAPLVHRKGALEGSFLLRGKRLAFNFGVERFPWEDRIPSVGKPSRLRSHWRNWLKEKD